MSDPHETGPRREVHQDACERLAALASRIAPRDPSPRRFLTALGREAAGIRPGPAGLVDLARGGRNILVGHGFKRRYDDATTGQVRHFAGTAVAVATLGPSATVWVSEHLRGDPDRSADGRLTEAAARFADMVLSGALPVAEAGGWIERTLCARD